MPKKATKTVKGNNYTEKDELYNKKRVKKDAKSMKTAGLAIAIKKAGKKKTSKLPKVKPQKKMQGFVK